MDNNQVLDYQIEQEINDNADVWELTSEKCPKPDCGGNLKRAYRHSGPDDFDVAIDKCDTCNEIWED